MNTIAKYFIDRYQLLEPLGEGGMAVVHKAYDTRLECEVAVKVIRVDNLPRNAEEGALKRFEREAKAVARLTHPNIVKVTDYGEEDGKPYLVMPYLPGGTLKQLIKERGQIPWQEAARILIPIAEALAYAHSQGVIHRDIKPSNILLTQSGQPMLTDFGVAKIIEDEATQDLTGTSATVGTPEYMSPEQITSKTVDARADLYSLGVVFYEMITGRKPFEADTPMAVLFKHVNDPLPNPSRFVTDLPKCVAYFLIKALAKKPEDRFQSGEDISKAFQEMIANPSSKVPFKQAHVNLTQKKWWGILAGIVIIGIVFSIVLLNNPPSPRADKIEEFTLQPLSNASTETRMPIFQNTSTQELPVIFTPEVPTSTATVVDQIILNIPENSEINCRNVNNEYGSVLKIFASTDSIIVNGIDKNKAWVNVYLEPVQSRTGESISDCWIFLSESLVLNQIEGLPVIQPRPIYQVYSVRIRAQSNIIHKDKYLTYEAIYFDIKTEEDVEQLIQTECAYLNMKGATYCKGTIESQYLSDLWVLKGTKVIENYHLY